MPGTSRDESFRKEVFQTGSAFALAEILYRQMLFTNLIKICKPSETVGISFPAGVRTQLGAYKGTGKAFLCGIYPDATEAKAKSGRKCSLTGTWTPHGRLVTAA